MRIVKSPGGSIFPYHYKGGQLHCLKYGSYFNNHDALLELMNAEKNFIMGTNTKMRIWVDFYETGLSEEIMVEFLKSIDRMNKHIIKLSIVGFSLLDKWRFKRMSEKMSIKCSYPIKFYKDPEEAKSWLVSEG